MVADGVQAAGILAAPLSELGADIVAIGHLRSLRADGLGNRVLPRIAAGRDPDAVRESAGGGETVRAHVNSQFDILRTAHRFEGGNPNFLGVRVRAGAGMLQSDRPREHRGAGTQPERGVPAQTGGGRPADADAAGLEERAQIVNVLVPDAAGGHGAATQLTASW